MFRFMTHFSKRLMWVGIFSSFALVRSARCQYDSLSPEQMRSLIQRFKESQTKGKLEYRVSLIKDTFILYEPVVAEMWVKNISQDTVRVLDPTVADWIIEDEKGNKYPPKVLNDVVDQRLSPADSFGGTIGIQHHGVSMPPPYPFFSFPVGKYNATFKVKDFTKIFVFYVVEPKGENAEAIKLYLEAFEPYWGEQFSRASPAERIELGKEEVRRLLVVADRYPRSPYANVALTKAISSAWGSAGDAELSHRLTLRALRELPQKNWTYMHFLRAYYETKGDALGLNNELDSIIRVNSHPRLTATARQELKKLESKK